MGGPFDPLGIRELHVTLFRLGILVPLRLGVKGFKEPPPVTFFAIKAIEEIYYDNLQFISSLFNFHLVSIDMTSYGTTIAVKTVKTMGFTKSS